MNRKPGAARPERARREETFGSLLASLRNDIGLTQAELRALTAEHAGGPRTIEYARLLEIERRAWESTRRTLDATLLLLRVFERRLAARRKRAAPAKSGARPRPVGRGRTTPAARERPELPPPREFPDER